MYICIYIADVGGVYFMERNAGLFHQTNKCDHGTINLILKYLTRNEELDDRGTVNLILL